MSERDHAYPIRERDIRILVSAFALCGLLNFAIDALQHRQLAGIVRALEALTAEAALAPTEPGCKQPLLLKESPPHD